MTRLARSRFHSSHRRSVTSPSTPGTGSLPSSIAISPLVIAKNRFSSVGPSPYFKRAPANRSVVSTDVAHECISSVRIWTSILCRRRVASYSAFVFASSVVTFRHPNNYRTSWREALCDTPWKGTTPKSFRNTVATVMHDELGIQAAKDQLGHEDERTTRLHYADEVHRSPAAGLVLSKLFT